MRKIAFRAWDKKGKRMLPVFSLDFWNDLILRKVDLGQDEFDVPKDAEVMQFTGLLDKNGREIYEGDVVKFPRSTHDNSEVFFRNGSFATYLENNKGTWLEISQNGFQDELEIIGNIYENPDLLKP